jgi:ATP-dependent Lon protease
VLANVLQLLKLPDGTVKVLVEGRERVRIDEFVENEAFFEARAELLDETPGDRGGDRAEPLGRRGVRALRQDQEEHPRGGAGRGGRGQRARRSWPTSPPAIWASTCREAGTAGDADVAERLEKVYGLMQGEISVLQVERKIKTRVKSQMERTQREYYLNEQMKAIQRELGDGEDGQNEVAELEERIAPPSSRRRRARRPRPS